MKREENEKFEHSIFKEISLRNDLEFSIKDLECENEKLQSKVKSLKKELVKTGTVEEQVITEIVTRENMKNEYDSILGSMREKHELLLKEKEESAQYYEKKVESLGEKNREMEEDVKKKDNQLRSWKGRNKERKWKTWRRCWTRRPSN